MTTALSGCFSVRIATSWRSRNSRSVSASNFAIVSLLYGSRVGPATCGRAILLPPNCRLGPSELVEFGSAQRRLCDREELVELRRRYGCAAERRVCLAAVMDLGVEQVQQKALCPLRLHARAPVHANDPIRPGFVQRLAPGDQSTVDRRLSGPP